MKRHASILMVMVVAGLAQVAMGAEAAKTPTPPTPRTIVLLDREWEFHKGPREGGNGGDAAWEKVTLPHTWNAKDGQDGGAPYYRGDGWYRRTFEVTQKMAERQIYLRFLGANRRAEVFVNGQKVGGHVGGTEAFTIDVTAAVKPGTNQLEVHVDNKPDLDSPPLQGDFTQSGGLYRQVELVATDRLHLSMSDYGSCGVYLTTPKVSDDAATVHVRCLVRNDGKDAAKAILFLQVRDANDVVGDANVPVAIGAGADGEFTGDLVIGKPHRWDGRRDPYLYTVDVWLVRGGENETADGVTQPLGIRTFRIDPEKGFILNDKPYPLQGVCRHQERRDKGWAISDDDHREDMALIKEMGCTSLRLAHYQHAELFYQLCDKEGMVVWAEVPVVDRLGSSAAFTENAQRQYTELIRQNFNHPCIVFWSAGNEVDESGGNFNKAGPEVYGWFREMSKVGHREDPSRLTASAWRERFFPPPDVTDVFGLNIYLGWYDNTFADLEEYIAKHSENGAKGKWAVTEYGAGSSIYFHSESPVKMDHTEEYQNLYHEGNWKVLKQHPEIWGKYVWNMFDFAVDSRFEGDRGGINDKGLVTEDRKVKKDAFYFYKASWSSEPTVYITSRRFAVRGVEQIPVKVYSNAAKVTLTVNDQPVGDASRDDVVFTWPHVPLHVGPNSVLATATFADGKTATDSVTFTYTPGAPQEVYVAQDAAMKKALLGGPPRVNFPGKQGATTRPVPIGK